VENAVSAKEPTHEVNEAEYERSSEEDEERKSEAAARKRKRVAPKL